MRTRALRAAAVITLLATAFLSHPLYAALTVQGTIRFENRSYSQSGWGSSSYSPSRYVTVRFLRSTDNALLHSTFTTASGTYNTTISSLNAGNAYKIQVLAETAAALVGNSPGFVWACTSVNTTATNVAFDIALSGGCAAPARALNVIDAMVEGYQWAEARAGGVPHQIDVLYPSTTHPQYDQDGNFIHIPEENAASNDDVVLHEYGHFLQDDFTASMILPGGSHSYCGSASSNNLAFSEAWATFITLAVRGKEWGVAYHPSTTLNSYQNFETATAFVNGSSVCVEQGADNELAIGAVLSDTRDSADESFDVVSGQQQKTWDIFDKTWQSRSSVPDVNQFRTDWGNETEMGPLFCQYIDSGSCVPSAPTANAATSVTSTSFQANWSSSPGATGYRLDVSTSSAFSTFVSGYNNLDAGNALSRSVTGLSASTTYYYRVRAYNGSGTSGNSNTISRTTSASAPPAPTANAASSVTTNSFQANWSSSAGANGYRLDVSTSNTFSSFVSGYNDLDVGAALSQSVTGLSASTTYYYRLRAYNGGGTSGNSNTVNTTTAGTAPPAPAANAASNITASSFQANWSPSAGAGGYRLDVATSNTFSSFVPGYNNADVGNVTSSSVSGLNASTTYYYRLRAYNGNGTSGNSNTITVATAGSGGTSLYLVTPCRMIDTRITNDPLWPSDTRTVAAAGVCGIPSDARALALNVTVVLPANDGWLTLYPADVARPATSTVSFRTGRTRANNSIVRLSNTGQVNIYNGSGVGTAVHILIDVTGYFR